MKAVFSILVFSVLISGTALCQTGIDTAYIRQYSQRMTFKGYLSNNSIQLSQDNKYYEPKNILNVGIGFSIKNTVVDFEYDYGVVKLGGKNRGKTKSVDFQIHRYGRHFLLDLLYQKYQGFYQGTKDIVLYPELSVRQIGAEGSYLFNGDKFSAKAAYDQSEMQLRSVGSFVLGGGIYLYQLKSDRGVLLTPDDELNNLQLGANAGYAYSWVLGKYWLLSAMATAGFNFGNEPQLLKKGDIEIYPATFARASAGYHRSDWATYFSMLIHNKSVYPVQQRRVDITPFSLQLTYVKHFDHFFKKK